jgi:hypothetical protein
MCNYATSRHVFVALNLYLFLNETNKLMPMSLCEISQTHSFSKTDVKSIQVRLQTIDEQNAPRLSRTSLIYKMLEINYGTEVASALRKEPWPIQDSFPDPDDDIWQSPSEFQEQSEILAVCSWKSQREFCRTAIVVYERVFASSARAIALR